MPTKSVRQYTAKNMRRVLQTLALAKKTFADANYFKGGQISLRVTTEILEIILQNTRPFEELSDGTIYLGGDAKGVHWATTPQMLPCEATHFHAAMTLHLMNSQKALDYSYADWWIPNQEVGTILYQNRNNGMLKGSFDGDKFGHRRRGIWLSRTTGNGWALIQQFDGKGEQMPFEPSNEFSVRPVRKIDHLIIQL